MTNILRKTAMASALAIATIAFSGVSMAQTQKCIGDNCPQQGQGMNKGTGEATPENNGDNMPTKKLRKNGTQSNDQVNMQNGEDQGDNGQMKKLRKRGTSTGQYQENNDQGSMKSSRQANWKFDSNRHERRRHRDTTFRFYFGGFWYAQPYWQEDYYVVGRPGYGISCRQGRNIVAERFDRVRVVECQGRAYTYLGRRHGGSFQIVLNSRSGRIIDVNEL